MNTLLKAHVLVPEIFELPNYENSPASIPDLLHNAQHGFYSISALMLPFQAILHADSLTRLDYKNIPKPQSWFNSPQIFPLLCLDRVNFEVRLIELLCYQSKLYSNFNFVEISRFVGELDY